jgi:hypothetical protein
MLLRSLQILAADSTMLILSLGLLVSCLPHASVQNTSPKKLKVYISVDMEGVVGTVTADQLRRADHSQGNETQT